MASDGTIIGRVDVNVEYQDQLAADLAFSAGRYFVAWHDRRVAPEQLFCTQVTAAGEVLSPEGTRLPGQDSANYQELVAVAGNGDGYLLAWLEYRATGAAVRAVRLSAAGVVLDSSPFLLSADTLGLDDVAVGSDGRDYIVLWSGETPGAVGADLCFRRISPTGVVLDSAPVVIASCSLGLSGAAVDFLGGRYCVVWQGMSTETDIYAARVTPGGVILDPGGFPVAADIAVQQQPDIAGDGERFLVVWSSISNDESDILGAFVDTAGNVGLTEVTGRPAATPTAPAVVHGTLYLGSVASAGPALLLDVMGRVVVALRPGPNDVSAHRPGVYFVRSGSVTARVLLAR